MHENGDEKEKFLVHCVACKMMRFKLLTLELSQDSKRKKRECGRGGRKGQNLREETCRMRKKQNICSAAEKKNFYQSVCLLSFRLHECKQ
jgi:hypothetical protein